LNNPIHGLRAYTTHHALTISNNTEAVRKFIAAGSNWSRLYRDEPTDGMLCAIDTTQDADWTIKNVSYTTSTATNFVSGGNVQISATTMTIEEYGAARFIYYLRQVSEKYLETSWFGLAFTLFTKIVGHGDDGTPKVINLAPRHLMLTKIDTNLSTPGKTVYTCEFHALPEGAVSYDPRFKFLNDPVSFNSKSTIGACISGLEEQINNTVATLMAKWFKQTDSTAGRPVLYRISVPKDFQSMKVFSTTQEKVKGPVRQKPAEQKPEDCAATEDKSQSTSAAEDKKKETKLITDWLYYSDWIKKNGGPDLNKEEPSPSVIRDLNAKFVEEHRPDQCKVGKNKSGGDKIFDKLPARPPQYVINKPAKVESSADDKAGTCFFSFPINTSIVVAIEEILKKSEDLMKATGAYDKFKNELATIDAQLESQFKAIDSGSGSPDEKSMQKKRLREQKKDEIVKTAANTKSAFTYTIVTRLTSDEQTIKLHFDVIKKFLPDIQSLSQQSVTSTNQDDLNPAVGNFVEFDYTFTGESKDIIEFNMGWKQGTQVLATNQSSVSTTNRGAEDPAINKTQSGYNTVTTAEQSDRRPAVEDSSAKVTREFFKYDPIVPVIPTVESSNKFSGYKQSTVTARNTFMRMCQAFSAAETVTSVRVRGNPALINSITPDLYPHDDFEYRKKYDAMNKMAEDFVAGSANDPAWKTSLPNHYLPIFVKINVKTISNDHIKSSSRMYNESSFDDFWYNGYYWVRDIETNFSESGAFDQKLTLLPYYIGVKDTGAGK
jgi:hypothetical protein